MIIVFEDGRKIDSENPGSELIKLLDGKPQEDYIFVIIATRHYPYQEYIFSEVCAHLDDRYYWIRDWWDGWDKTDTIKICCIESVNKAGELVNCKKNAWGVEYQ